MDIADFSPGPWWGYNGVRTLALTQRGLNVLRTGFALGARRDPQRAAMEAYDLSSITNVRTTNRKAYFGQKRVLTMRVTVNMRDRTFTTKYSEAETLADMLADLVSKHP